MGSMRIVIIRLPAAIYKILKGDYAIVKVRMQIDSSVNNCHSYIFSCKLHTFTYLQSYLSIPYSKGSPLEKEKMQLALFLQSIMG